MLSATNLWMCLAALICLCAGILVRRKELSTGRASDKLIALAPVFIAVSLAAFAPEHFYGPEFVQNSVPSWMPGHAFWAYFVGCALLAAAASLTTAKFVRLSSTLLGLMFFLFVCLIHVPTVLAHPENRFAWTVALRDLSFAAGAWALAGLPSRPASPLASRWSISFARFTLAVTAIFFAVQHFLHSGFAPGVPLELPMPAWVIFPQLWSYLAGAVLMAGGIGLILNKRPRISAAVIGALITVLTLFPYLVILILTRNGSASDLNEAINFVADTLLFAGSALAVASAFPS